MAQKPDPVNVDDVLKQTGLKIPKITLESKIKLSNPIPQNKREAQII